MSKRFWFGNILVLLSCHWRGSWSWRPDKPMWLQPRYWLSAHLIRNAGEPAIGICLLLLCCELSIIRMSA